MLKSINFLLGVVFLLVIIFLPGFSKIQELKQENKRLDEKIADIKKKNIFLEQEKIKLETDKTYIERIARQKIGIIKKGEIVYKISTEE
jgi:cell division protein FtsB